MTPSVQSVPRRAAPRACIRDSNRCTPAVWIGVVLAGPLSAGDHVSFDSNGGSSDVLEPTVANSTPALLPEPGVPHIGGPHEADPGGLRCQMSSGFVMMCAAEPGRYPG